MALATRPARHLGTEERLLGEAGLDGAVAFWPETTPESINVAMEKACKPE